MRHFMWLVLLFCAAPLCAQSHPQYQPPTASELDALKRADAPEIRAGADPKPAVSESEQAALDALQAESGDELRDLKGGRRSIHVHGFWDDWVYWALLPSITVTVLVTIIIIALII